MQCYRRAVRVVLIALLVCVASARPAQSQQMFLSLGPRPIAQETAPSSANAATNGATANTLAAPAAANESDNKSNANSANKPTDKPSTDSAASGPTSGAQSSDAQGSERRNTDPSNSESAAEEIDPLAATALTLADVIASSLQSFPKIEQARLQAGVAAGEATAARGFYDHKLQAYSLAEPTGFYENYRSGIGLARQLWWGGYLSAGYRSGRGKFAPWYKERETNKGGEFKLSLVQPLLQGRAIDPARVAVLQANLRIQAVEPEIERNILMIAREGSENYWQWLAANSYLQSQEQLLKLAEVRGQQLKDLVEAGKSKAVDLLINDQLIAERRVKVIETRQKFREYGVKLSFYLRDEAGQPLYPREEWAPGVFPRTIPLPPGDFNADMAAALSRRPELRGLSFEIQHTTLDLRLAENQLAPQLDWISGASQDVGTPASSPDDKGQFELEFGLEGEVPIQRRKARGKIQSLRGKLAQLDQEIRAQRDKIGVELMTARNAIDQAALEIDQAEAALKASIEVLDRFNFAFKQGQVDLIYINLLESKVTEYEIKLVESRQKWFAALAAMQAALGLDPLEQALNLLSMNLPVVQN